MKLKRFTAPPYMTNTYCLYDTESQEGIFIDLTGDLTGIHAWLEAEKLTILASLFTHAHGDHFPQSAPAWSLKFPWYAHKNALVAFEDPTINLSEEIYGEEVVYTEVLALSDSMEQNIGKFHFEVMETPGHTAGSVCYRFGQVIFSGDTLFKESVGRTDLPTGSMVILTDSLNRMFSQWTEDFFVYPGHGPQTSMEYERRVNPYLEGKR
ncbi:MBL fold metallo-hydrolase [Gottschalkiaceae bacterium SANA]|nr:MBL fold metallo-hydrolase [Gottschalkiaceae bacterium SANA]